MSDVVGGAKQLNPSIPLTDFQNYRRPAAARAESSLRETAACGQRPNAPIRDLALAAHRPFP
jgi:hypothetical protein